MAPRGRDRTITATQQLEHNKVKLNNYGTQKMFHNLQTTRGADKGFLERGFISIMVCVWGGGVVIRFADLISFVLNIP